MNSLILAILVGIPIIMVLFYIRKLYKKNKERKANNLLITSNILSPIYIQHNITNYNEYSETDSNKSYAVDDSSYIVDDLSYIIPIDNDINNSYITDEKSYRSSISTIDDSKSLTMTQINSLSNEENDWVKKYTESLRQRDNLSFTNISNC